jgi:hypothetical protein
MSEKPEGTEFESPPNQSAVDHCRRCLTSKRRDKGDEYMLKHGYPLLDHPLRGSSCLIKTKIKESDA